MRPIYLRKNYNSSVRKILVDMAYLASHKKIRLPKIYFEKELYLPYLSENGQVEKYFLDRDKIKSEDNYHYFFDLPFTLDQIENAAE